MECGPPKAERRFGFLPCAFRRFDDSTPSQSGVVAPSGLCHRSPYHCPPAFAGGFGVTSCPLSAMECGGCDAALAFGRARWDGSTMPLPAKAVSSPLQGFATALHITALPPSPDKSA